MANYVGNASVEEIRTFLQLHHIFFFFFFFFFRLGGSISINEYTSTKECQLPWQANERFQHSSGGFLIYKFHLKLKVKTVCRELYRRRY